MKISRRQFLGSGTGVLSSYLIPALSHADSISANSTPKIHGLTTFKPEALTHTATQVPTQTISTAVLSLDIDSGLTKTTSLEEYRFGHSLLSLPYNNYFAVPYGDDEIPCLFLDKDFNIQAEIYAPLGYGFGGHSVVTRDKTKVFTHFNKERSAGSDPKQKGGISVLIDIKQKKIMRKLDTNILHAHDIILSKDKKLIIVGDDGNLNTNQDDTFSINSFRPALHLFDSNSGIWQRSIALPINGSLVHLDNGIDGRIYGGTEQYVPRNKNGFAALQKHLGGQTQSYIQSFDPEIFIDEIPLPGPLLAINLSNGGIKKHLDIKNQDPFDIKTNLKTGNTISVFTSHNRIARYDASNNSWQYKSTEDYQIVEPFGLTNIMGTPYMAVNGFDRGIAIFHSQTLALHRYYDVSTHGLKHMIYSA